LDNGVAELELVGESTAALERLLSFCLVFPEIRCGDARLERGQFCGAAGSVKDSSEDLWRV
jgi:hypothetical protein